MSTAHGTESKTISVTQLDKVSNYFYIVSENGSFGRNSSSDYNHKLATWAMELSYAAYNYPNGEELPIIPGAFMGDFVKSANTLLSENGFVNITDLNYGSNENGAHTIGWRPIGGVDTGLLQIFDDIGGNYNVGWDNTSDEELYVWNFLDRLRTLDGNSGRADSGNVAVLAGKDNVVDVIQSSAIRTMPLVVVDVRGSVTLSDWINDVMTQFDSENNRFAAFADEIFTNVETFYSVSENGSFGRNSSSDYNHKLATWAMELSYAAYNYPNGEELPIIPGAFMGDFTKTAGMFLEDNGFVNISEYNYTSDSRAAHTIGWRPVEVAVSETSQIINDAGGIGNVYQYNIDDKGSVLYNLLDSVRVHKCNSSWVDRGTDTRLDRSTFEADKINEGTIVSSSVQRTLLEDNGFVNISEYNYTSDSRASHTIGYRFVEFPENENMQLNDGLGGNIDVSQHYGTNIQLPVRDLLDSVCILERNSHGSDRVADTRMDRDTFRSDKISTDTTSLLNTKRLDGLVVVDIRGSVTAMDWYNDIMTQLSAKSNRFAALAEEMLTNVNNYIRLMGLQDPIILITGHSMGAAIANILAASLNETMDSGNIYAYTFATPLDRVSSCFNNIDSYGNITDVTASDYNHRLATWAMELSYAAYNYPNGEELPIIPGAFMGDFTQTAGMLLEDNGFVNISEYNYTSDSRAAHTIGWRPVEVAVSEASQIINDAGGNYNVGQYNGTNRQLLVRDLLGSVHAVGLDQRRTDIYADRRLDRRVSESDKINEGAIVLSSVQGTLLEDNGFVNISEYNYTSDSRAAHTIGWRPVEVAVSETSQIINDAGGIGNVYQYNIDDKGSVLYNLLDQLRVDRSAHLFDERRDTGADRYDSITNSQSFAAGNKILKPLLVVDIRGSVTWWDWVNDIGAQALPFNNRFAALAEEAFTNVKNYLSSTGLQDPIILVTGHSMGAAIANILAARLNETMDSGNIYAYTFATQLDRVSNCFNNIDSYGNVTAVTASDYNHRLATWAMELSYAAYNYPNGEELPIIPGAFMGDFTQTAGMLLEDNGFVNISEYNYTSDSRAAHTIGWRPVEVAVSETSQIINDAGGIGNVYQYNIDDKGSVLYNLLDSVCVYERNTCRSNSGNPEIMDRNVDVLEVSENSLATTTIKNLVVIDIRGSVTLLDWGNDIVTQFAPNNNRFAALADEVLTNVENYLSSTGLQDPIILVTGHSMGAAIANILAARLNGIMDPGNIYAYTFTFTRW